MSLSTYQPEYGSHLARLRVAVAVVRTNSRAIPLVMIAMRKSIHGFPLLPYMRMVVHLVAAGAPLLKAVISDFQNTYPLLTSSIMSLGRNKDVVMRAFR